MLTSNIKKLIQITTCLNESVSFKTKNKREIVSIVVEPKLKYKCLFKILVDRVATKPPSNNKYKKSPAKNKSA
jgi:hypothetical protein